MAGVAFRDTQIREFLSSEPTWTERLGNGWTGIKFLGKGGNGICGLWQFKGRFAKVQPKIRYVVVKQFEADGMDDGNTPGGLVHWMKVSETWSFWRYFSDYALYLASALGYHRQYCRSELTRGWFIGRIMEALNGADTRHLIRSYGGNKVGDSFMEMGKVVRLFLEYAEGGNLRDLLAGYNDPRKTLIEEADIWELFYCLALGVHAMDDGNEDPTGNSGWGGRGANSAPYMVVHFDIKPDNLLFGNRDIEHPRIPILKIADFGEAVKFSKFTEQDTQSGGFCMRRGSTLTSAPEETVNLRDHVWNATENPDAPMTRSRKGTCSNIFQVGCVMNFLLLGKQTSLNEKGLKLGKVQFAEDNEYQHRRPMLCHSQGLDDPEITKHYSKALIDMVKKCMLRESEDRPNASRLVIMVRRYRDQVLKDAGDKRCPPPGDLGKVRIAGMNPPEPPDEWLYEISSAPSDLAEWDADMEDMEKAKREFPSGATAESQSSPPANMRVGL